MFICRLFLQREHDLFILHEQSHQEYTQRVVLPLMPMVDILTPCPEQRQGQDASYCGNDTVQQSFQHRKDTPGAWVSPYITGSAWGKSVRKRSLACDTTDLECEELMYSFLLNEAQSTAAHDLPQSPLVSNLHEQYPNALQSAVGSVNQEEILSPSLTKKSVDHAHGALTPSLQTPSHAFKSEDPFHIDNDSARSGRSSVFSELSQNRERTPIMSPLISTRSLHQGSNHPSHLPQPPSAEHFISSPLMVQRSHSRSLVNPAFSTPPRHVSHAPSRNGPGSAQRHTLTGRQQERHTLRRRVLGEQLERSRLHETVSTGMSPLRRS